MTNECSGECGLDTQSNSPSTSPGEPFSKEDEQLFKNPLVQALLDYLPKASLSTPFSIDFPISKSVKDEGRFIIAGYASVEVIDQQNELIPIPVLKDAWSVFKDSNYFKIGSLMHTNIPVIKVLDEYKDSKGQTWKSGVDKNGLFIVAEVREDIEKGKQTRELIEKGVLTGFSIGGEALASSVVCEGRCYTRIDKMELHEIAVVDRPANQPSVFTIVKSERLRKLAELTDALPNLVISPGVASIGGSIAELGKGHDFDVIIRATEGSFVDRAIQTRIFNELRKTGREDLWKSIQIIHEPEGLGPYTDYYDLYDLVLLRSPLEKKNMIVKRDQTVEKYLGSSTGLLLIKAGEYQDYMERCIPEKMRGAKDKQTAFKGALLACVKEWKAGKGKGQGEHRGKEEGPMGKPREKNVNLLLNKSLQRLNGAVNKLCSERSELRPDKGDK